MLLGIHINMFNVSTFYAFYVAQKSINAAMFLCVLRINAAMFSMFPIRALKIILSLLSCFIEPSELSPFPTSHDTANYNYESSYILDSLFYDAKLLRHLMTNCHDILDFLCFQIMKLMNAVLGEKLFNMLMKSTFYGHFVAGEDQVKIVPTLER